MRDDPRRQMTDEEQWEYARKQIKIQDEIPGSPVDMMIRKQKDIVLQLCKIAWECGRDGYDWKDFLRLTWKN